MELNPSYAQAYTALGVAQICAGRTEEGVASLAQHLALGEQDVMRGQSLAWTGMAKLIQGRFEEAAEWARQSLNLPSTLFWANAVLTSAYGHLDREKEAAAARDVLLQRQPQFSIAFAERVTGIVDPTSRATLIKGLRKAGVAKD